ncbi:MAG: DNA-formamidopyrimidine glycosylase [Phycisphaerae bacterium]|nr:DNA-formamidopyrimidine glycosylase [Phycisphaerae bacterium]
MPELPEVETVVRHCRPRLVGRRVVRFVSHWKKQVSPSLGEAERGVVGRRVTGLTRRAKYIVWEFDDGGHLLVHLRMSGSLAWAGDGEEPAKHVRAFWELDDGQQLQFCDARKFGRIIYTRDLAATTADLGPEPLDRRFTPRVLGELLHGRARQVKPLLLDQGVIAGLGNIYTDEVLHRSGVHPATDSRTLTDEQVGRLHQAIREVLREAIRFEGTSFDWVYGGGRMQERLYVYGRAGLPCPRCGTPIERLVIGQRGTHICPKCQLANGVCQPVDGKRRPAKGKRQPVTRESL